MAGSVELHNPIGHSDYLSIHHIERYRFALTQLTRGQMVLDIASGAGYGDAILSVHGCKVLGADYELDTHGQYGNTTPV